MPSWIRAAPLAVAVVLALLGVALSVTYILGIWPSEASHVDWADRLERIRNVAIILGGIAALGLAYWRGRAADRQATAAQEQVETTVRQIDVAHEQVQAAQQQERTAQQGQLHERYENAAEMLGSSVLAVRLGGIQALRRLAKEVPDQYCEEVITLLCAFARLPPADPKSVRGAGKTTDAGSRGPQPREDVLEAVKAVGTLSSIRPSAGNQSELVLEGLDLRGATLIDANLADASLWDADLAHTFFLGVNLSESRLWHVNLAHARWSEVDLTGVDFGHAEDMHGAIFESVDMTDAKFVETNLTGVDFTGGGEGPVRGLTQRQLDDACADRDMPPNLDGVTDAKTGEPLVWRGATCDDSHED